MDVSVDFVHGYGQLFCNSVDDPKVGLMRDHQSDVLSRKPVVVRILLGVVDPVPTMRPLMVIMLLYTPLFE